MTLFYLIRHGRSVWNAAGRIQGQADPPLDDLGRRQAQALAVRLQAENLNAVYSSPLIRARETAEIIAVAHAWPLTFDDRLMERNFGEWTGLNGDDLIGQVMSTERHQFWVNGPPGGESRDAVTARAEAAFADMLAAHPQGTVAVVSHGGLLSAYIRHVLGIPPEKRVHFGLGNASLTRLRLDDGGVHLLSVGDVRHLEDLLS